MCRLLSCRACRPFWTRLGDRVAHGAHRRAGRDQALAQPAQKHGRLTVSTLWGELAWQLGKEVAYERVKEADRSGTQPARSVGRAASRPRPLRHPDGRAGGLRAPVRRGQVLRRGTYDSNLSFVQALTEVSRRCRTPCCSPRCPSPTRRRVASGRQRAPYPGALLRAHPGVVEAVASEEAFEIVRRRLFTDISERRAAEAVCRAFADYYVANAADVPTRPRRAATTTGCSRPTRSTPRSRPALRGLVHADNFQRTRGVLKLMAKVIHRLWKTATRPADHAGQPAAV